MPGWSAVRAITSSSFKDSSLQSFSRFAVFDELSPVSTQAPTRRPGSSTSTPHPHAACLPGPSDPTRTNNPCIWRAAGGAYRTLAFPTGVDRRGLTRGGAGGCRTGIVASLSQAGAASSRAAPRPRPPWASSTASSRTASSRIRWGWWPASVRRLLTRAPILEHPPFTPAAFPLRGPRSPNLPL